MTNPVRRALLADAAPLLDLIRQHAAFEQGAAPLSETDLAHILAAEQAPINLIVAEEGGELIGYAALTFDYALWTAGRFAHLDCLFVRSTARGRGIGRLLFECVCLMAELAGARRIEWQTPAWNVDAIRFYEREGGLGQPRMRFSKRLPADFGHDRFVAQPGARAWPTIPLEQDLRFGGNGSTAG